MTFTDKIAVLILTRNEEPNLRRTLSAVSAFSEVVIVDSESTDATCDIASSFNNVRVVARPFTNHAEQWNFGLSLCTGREWVLALDADYLVTPALVDEIEALEPANAVAGYQVRFRYVSMGRVLRGSLYPPSVVLFRRNRAHFRQEGHTQRLSLNGPVSSLEAAVYHDDRKSLSRWIASQRNYASLEAVHLRDCDRTKLSLQDRLRLMAWPAPLLVLPYVLIAKGCLFDGWPGWFYALQRLVAECLLALELIEQRRHHSQTQLPR